MKLVLAILVSLGSWCAAGLAFLLPKNRYIWMKSDGLPIPDDPDSALVVNTLAVTGILLSLLAVAYTAHQN